MHKPDFRAMVSRKNLIRLGISVVVSMLLGMAVDLVLDAHKREELSAVRADAYVAIAQFAPWNIAERYIQIVSTQGNADAQAFAQQQEENRLALRKMACAVHFGGADNPCLPTAEPHGLQAFYLSAYVPLPLRPVTGLFDLLLHMLIDQGIAGFLVAAAQIALGALLTRLFIKRSGAKMETVYSYILGIPFGIIVLGSLAALPLWLLALAGMTALKAFPAGGIGAQAGATTYFVAWVGGKTAEQVGHEAVMKQVERVVGD